MHDEPSVVSDRSKKLVAVVAIMGVLVLASAAFIGFKRRSVANGPSIDASDEARAWCELRRRWGKDLDALNADILLKSVRQDQQAQVEQLELQRTQACKRYREQLQQLTGALADPTVRAIEAALIKEGKARANTSVQIANVMTRAAAGGGSDAAHLAAKDVAGHLALLRAAHAELRDEISDRIAQQRRSADREIAPLLDQLAGCSAIYRGPITDQNTSDDPYVSWEELDLRRQQALAELKRRIKELEPREQFTNQVYHELIRKYRSTIKSCYQKERQSNSNAERELNLQIRFKASGAVATLAAESLTSSGDRILDCLLRSAAQWRLPAPPRQTDVVAVKLDLSAL